MMDRNGPNLPQSLKILLMLCAGNLPTTSLGGLNSWVVRNSTGVVRSNTEKRANQHEIASIEAKYHLPKRCFQCYLLRIDKK